MLPFAEHTTLRSAILDTDGKVDERGSPMLRSGLDPELVNQWRRRIGPVGALGPHRSIQVRSRGRQGIDLYLPIVEFDAEVPEDFEQIAYWRPLGSIFTFCYLQTPVRTMRTAAHIRECPSNFLVLASISTGLTTGTANGHEFLARAGELSITDSRLPYDLTTHSTSEVTGIWIPTDMLGDDIAAGATVAPNPADTVLTRACTGLVTRFALDAVIGGIDVDAAAEQNIIDVVRMLLNQHTSRYQTLREQPIVLREAIDGMIDRNFRNPTFTADTIATHLHISKRHLYRQLADPDQPSLAVRIAARRLDWARSQLEQPGQARLGDIAHAAGFSSTATFRNRFRAKYGLTPDEYRRHHCAQPVHRG